MKKTIKNAVQDEKIKEVFRHIGIINKEIGMVEKKIGGVEKISNSLKSGLGNVKIGLAKVSTDVSWIKKFFWIIATASIASLIGAIINLIVNK